MVVVKVDADKVDVADALKKTLREKAKGLPKAVQETIQQKLQAVKEKQRMPVEVEITQEVVSARQTKRKATEAQHRVKQQEEVTITAAASPEGDEKKICIALAIDGKEFSAKDGAKAITVTVNDGKIILNGESIELPMLKKASQQQVRVQIKKAERDDARRTAHRRMIFLSKDGKAQEFEFDIDVDVDQVKDAAKAAMAKAHVQVVAAATKGQQDAAVNKAHAEFTKRLKGIETELKKIRWLLEQMRDDEHHDDHDHD